VVHGLDLFESHGVAALDALMQLVPQMTASTARASISLLLASSAVVSAACATEVTNSDNPSRHGASPSELVT
jgi:hypothetical protein